MKEFQPIDAEVSLFGDIFLIIQQELRTHLLALSTNQAYIVNGCEFSNDSISAGIILIDNKLYWVKGISEVNFPLFLMEEPAVDGDFIVYENKEKKPSTKSYSASFITKKQYEQMDCKNPVIIDFNTPDDFEQYYFSNRFCDKNNLFASDKSIAYWDGKPADLTHPTQDLKDHITKGDHHITHQDWERWNQLHDTPSDSPFLKIAKNQGVKLSAVDFITTNYQGLGLGSKINDCIVNNSLQICYYDEFLNGKTHRYLFVHGSFETNPQPGITGFVLVSFVSDPIPVFDKTSRQFPKNYTSHIEPFVHRNTWEYQNTEKDRGSVHISVKDGWATVTWWYMVYMQEKRKHTVCFTTQNIDSF